MSTNDRIWNMISKRPMTQSQIAGRLGVTTKRVRNVLGEIHSEFATPKSRRARGRQYAIINGNERFYTVLTARTPPRTKRLNYKNFSIQPTNVISPTRYPTVVYK